MYDCVTGNNADPSAAEQAAGDTALSVSRRIGGGGFGPQREPPNRRQGLRPPA